MRRLAPVLIFLFLFPMLSPLGKAGCQHMGKDCTHGGACPLTAKAAETAICQTGQDGHDGHNGHGQGHEAGEAGCGLYISCDDPGAEEINFLEIPFLVNPGSTVAPDTSGEPVQPFLSSLPSATPPGSEEPPEGALIS